MSFPTPRKTGHDSENTKRIRVLFTLRLPERVRRIREAFEQMASLDGVSVAAGTRQLSQEVNRLAGLAESFGGARLGEAAARIDQRLRSPTGEEGVLSPEDIAALGELINELSDSEREFLRWMKGEMVPRDRGSVGSLGVPFAEGRDG